MPIEAFLGMVDPMNTAWESWDSRFLGAETGRPFERFVRTRRTRYTETALG